ncbi:tetratricopeptide repeat-containing sensor histidine kinase [Mucilaginibacter sp.]|uniref:ATP-binding protein n=1 Tax=Mucilaginibacter sp. TaxID=1882438 RepID=UPI0025CD48A2|nr:tetratricopeptide repeat-containing sensor histidine kinase [Mucilaginibacter sp.]
MRFSKIVFIVLMVFSAKLFAQSPAIDSLKKVIATHKNTEEECISMNRLSSALTRYDMNAAKNYSYKVLKLAPRFNLPRLLNNAYCQLVTIYFNTGMIDSSRFCLNEAKSLADAAPSNSTDGLKMKMNYHGAAGLFYKMEGNYKLAMFHMLSALDIATKMDPSQAAIESAAGQSLNVGNTYISLGDFKKALTYHLKSLNLFLKIGNQKGEAFCYQGIANDFTELHLYKQALPYALKSQALKKTIADKRGAVTAIFSLGVIYHGLKNYKEALAELNTALQLDQEMNILTEQPNILREIANTYVDMNMPKDAISYLVKAKLVASKSGDNSAIAAIDAKIVFLQSDYREKKKAEEKMLNDIAVAIKHGDKNQELNSYKYLSKFYSGQKDFEKALTYNEKYHKTVDSVQNNELTLQVKKLEEQSVVDRKEREIVMLKKDQKISRAYFEKQQALKYSAITVSALVLLVIVLAAYRTRTMQKAKAIIEMDKMRTSIARDLHDDIGSRLTNIQFLTELIKNPAIGGRTEKDHLTDIREELLASTEALDEIVWNMKTKPDDQGTLQVRMRRYAGDIFDSNNMDYHMNVEEGFSDQSLSHEKQRDIFLIFREILNNIRKHAFAGYVSINLKANKDQLCLEIKDDGKGFDPATINKGRNGLQNIKSRVEKWNGNLVITSENGTFFSVSIPVQKKWPAKYDIFQKG